MGAIKQQIIRNEPDTSIVWISRLDQFEEQAIRYRSRWRMIGLISSALFILVGIGVTGEVSGSSHSLDWPWMVLTILSFLMPAAVGEWVYVARSPWE
jgi:hypothetical protein